MNEKEAIKILQPILDVSEYYYEQQKLKSIIEWLQLRADIKDLMDNPSDLFDPQNKPYFYNWAQMLADDALLELTMFMRMDLGLSTLHSAIKTARSSKKVFRHAVNKGVIQQ